MEHIDNLIAKYLTGEISDQEVDALLKWKAESPDNRLYIQQMLMLWEGAARLKTPLPRPLDVESALKKTKSRIAAEAAPKIETRIFQLKSWWFAAAAALAVAVAAVVFFQKTDAAAPVEIAATDAVRREILADGSKIALNQHSKIKAEFSQKSRRVELQGEAFFEVAHDAAKPFTVVVKNLEITAVGTAFNVDETDAARVFVRMSEGKVRLISGSQTIFLTAGEEAVFDEKTGAISTQKMFPISPANGWLERRFDFDETPLSEVIPVLEKAYNVRISLKNNELGNCKLRTRFSNEPIERVIEVLAETFSLKIERVGGGYILDGAGCD